MHKEPLMNIKTHQIGKLNTPNLLSNMFWILTQSPKRLKRYKTALSFPIPQKIWNKDKIHPFYRNPQNLSMFLIPCQFLLIKSKNCLKLRKLKKPALLLILIPPRIIKISKKPKNSHRKMNLKIAKNHLKMILREAIPYSPPQTTIGLKTHDSENPHVNSIKNPPKKMAKYLSKNLMKYLKFSLLRNLSNRNSTTNNSIKLNSNRIKKIQDHMNIKSLFATNFHLIKIQKTLTLKKFIIMARIKLIIKIQNNELSLEILKAIDRLIIKDKF